MALKDEQDGVPAQVLTSVTSLLLKKMKVKMMIQSLLRRKKATLVSQQKILRKKDLLMVFLEGDLLLHRGDLRQDHLVVALRLVEV